MIRSRRALRESGQGLTEYVILVALVAILLIPSLSHTFQSTASAYTASAKRLGSLGTSAPQPSVAASASTRPGGSGVAVGVGVSTGTGSGSSAASSGAGGGTGSGAGGPAASLGSSGSSLLTSSLLGAGGHAALPGGPLGSGPATTPIGATPGSPNPATPGGASAPHKVELGWDASKSPNVTGYNIYRADTINGPLTKLNTSPVPTTSFSDTTVVGGHEYFYVTTAVDAAGIESPHSNEIHTVIPMK
jgi:Flp pilus assembly pilin Flp